MDSPHRGHPPTASRRHGRRHSTIVVPPPAALMAQRESPREHSEQYIHRSAIGAIFLILLQFFSKVLTFSLNQTLLRFLSPERLGVSTQLELLNTSILFFSREAIRIGIQRQTTSPKPDTFRMEGGVVEGTVSGIAQSVVNVGYIAFLAGIPLAGLFSFWYYIRGASIEVSGLPYFKSVVVIYGIASIVELASEPMFALAQYDLQYKLRAICESAAVIARCVITFFLTVSTREDTGVLAFALGQLAYAGVLTGLYVCLVWERTRGKENSILPKRIWKEEISRSPWFYFHHPTIKLASTLWLQTVFKHYLTEGDKFLASYFSTISEQGLYALAANYGSLLARLVFFPIEESSRSLFAKLLAAPIIPSNLRSASDSLTTMLRVYSHLAIFCFVIGPSAAPFLLTLVAGKKWTTGVSGKSVISAYAYYIPLLAFNGILEAFVQSGATPAQVREQSALMLGFSAVFALCGYLFIRVLKFGAPGLVYANMVNLSLRIVSCGYYIGKYYQISNGLDEKQHSGVSGRNNETLHPLKRRSSWPSIHTVVAGAIAWVVVRAISPIDTWMQFFSLSAIAIALALVIIYEERELIRSTVGVIMEQRSNTRELDQKKEK
ncbi:Rft protein-domain-containing protein [Lipomyces japonicus]|uniref:Rft protein-domain-containing protein n=1 Tax=Lipomyces japonicus TaxID=56871 RepID=UPI0034CD83FF